MTNLFALILLTNVTETFPQMTVPASPPDGANPFNAVFYSKTVPVTNPTEKWITTSIVERVTFTNFWNSTPVFGTKERVITNWTTRFTLVPPPPPAWVASTNNTLPPSHWPMGSLR